jgi:peroxiredoxin
MEEVPLLKQLSGKFAGKVQIVGISTDESVERVDRVVKEKGMTWPIVSDGRGFDGPIPTAYHVQGTPDLFALDGDGRIVKRFSSATDIEATVAPLLAPRR